MVLNQIYNIPKIDNEECLLILLIYNLIFLVGHIPDKRFFYILLIYYLVG